MSNSVPVILVIPQTSPWAVLIGSTFRWRNSPSKNVFFFIAVSTTNKIPFTQKVSEAEISKSRQVRPKLSAWLDITRDSKKKYASCNSGELTLEINYRFDIFHWDNQGDPTKNIIFNDILWKRNTEDIREKILKLWDYSASFLVLTLKSWNSVMD